MSPGAYIFQRPLLRGLFLEGLIFGGAYPWMEICLSKSIRLALQLKVPFFALFYFVFDGNIPSTSPRGHRRTGNFRPGGAVNHLPKKLLQVAQIFTKQSRRNKSHTMQQHRPYWHKKVPQYSFSGSIYTCQV